MKGIVKYLSGCRIFLCGRGGGPGEKYPGLNASSLQPSALSFQPSPAPRRAGVTLTELMVALAVLTIGVIGAMGAFQYINKAITQSRLKTIASNLAQEEMEVLKNKSYFQLLVTTATAVSDGYSPNFVYDTLNYPPQTITLWGMPALTRRVNVDYITVSGSNATILPYTSSDPGMKKISVYVTWNSDGIPRKVQLDSYYENPSAAVLSAGFTGRVTNAAGTVNLGNVLVQVQGSSKWQAYSDPVTGIYSFQVAPGTYTLVCSTPAYFSTVSPTLSVADGAYTTQDFALTRIATATISGMVYTRNHLVISQVVTSTVMVTGVDVEYVELYNPTTWTIQIQNNVNIRYLAEASGHNVDPFNLSFINSSVGPGRYYFIANTFPLTIASASGGALVTDALFNSPAPPCISHFVPTYKKCIRAGESGAIQIYDANGPIDTVGWSHGAAGQGAPDHEGTELTRWDGFPGNLQLRRTSEYQHTTIGYGRAYDSNDNSADFEFIDMNNAWLSTPSWTGSGVKPPLTGTPAAGAIVTAGDGLSSSAQVSATGYFLLTNVATSVVQGASNSWTITISSYNIMSSSAGVRLTAAQNKDLGTIILATACTSGIATGYVFGAGPDYYRRLGTPSIRVGSGGITANTDSQGLYMLFLPTGTVTITANYGSYSGSYQPVDIDVTLALGTVTQVPDFHLAQGGFITGYVTSGTGALPNIVVQAASNGTVYSDTSDSTGHFYIYATTSSAAYDITPELDTLQSYTSLPATPLTVNLTMPGSTVFSGTITVVGAVGTIAGTVTLSSASITTGVLVVASTAAVTDPLTAVTASVSPSQAIFYSVSSQADGTYSLDVRSSSTTTYNMRAFYTVVDPVSGAVSYTTRAASGVSVSAGVTTLRNFSW